MTKCDLEGIGVLITRPADQARFLAERVRERGGLAVLLPGVEIEPVDAKVLKTKLTAMGKIDMAVFVSPTAVRLGVAPMLDALGGLQHLRLAAVGQSTVAELEKFGLTNIIAPQDDTGAQALVACPEMADVAKNTVLIVRGAGGSAFLETSLRERGARVDFLECYRRRVPQTDFSEVSNMLRDGRVGAWMATSGEILDNLLNMAGSKSDLLRRTPLFVNHSHVAVRAFSQGARTVFVCRGGDEGMVDSLATWFCRLRPAC